MKRRHEIICREGFQKLLRSYFPNSHQRWNEPDNDPPDWFLEFEDKIYAVEATSITDQIDVGDGSIPAPTVMHSLTSFVDELEQAAQDQGILTGAYLVALAPIPNLREHKQEFISLFLDYIFKTKDVESAPEKDLGYIRNNHISIVKLHSEAQYIGEMISTGAKSGHDAQEELEIYLKSAIQTKKTKLCHIHEPKILLVLDGFYYSEISDWSEALSGIEEKKYFELIARVSSPDGAQVIWNPNQWLKV